jgi:hypothetical protein
VAWCQYGSPDELPNIHHRKDYESNRTEELPDYHLTCIFVDRDYRRKGVVGVALRGALELIAKAAAASSRGIRRTPRARRSRPRFSTTPRAASTSRPASHICDPRARTTAGCAGQSHPSKRLDGVAPGCRWRFVAQRTFPNTRARGMTSRRGEVSAARSSSASP